MWAIVAHAVELSMDLPQSLANLRHLLSPAKVRSTTYPRGRTSGRVSKVVEILWRCPPSGVNCA